MTLSVEFPEDVRDDVIRIFSRTKRDLTIETTYVYGFRPASKLRQQLMEVDAMIDGMHIQIVVSPGVYLHECMLICICGNHMFC